MQQLVSYFSNNGNIVEKSINYYLVVLFILCKISIPVEIW